MTNDLTTTKGALPPLQTRAMSDLISIFRNRLISAPGGHILSADEMPSPSARQALQGRSDELARWLDPGTPGAAAKALGALFLGFPSGRGADEAKAAVAVYASQMRDLPSWAVERACAAAIRKGGKYAPSAGEFHALASAEVAAFRRERAQILQILDADAVSSPDPESRARVADGWRKLAVEIGLMDGVGA